MAKDEAIACLQTQCWFDPQLSDAQAEALWQPYRIAVEQLPERQLQTPQRLPIPRHAQSLVNDFRARTRGPEVLDVINIDPRSLAIYQFYVAVDRADHHAQCLGNNDWARTCLQLDRPVSQLPIRLENNAVKVVVPHGEHTFALRPDGAFQIQQTGGFISVCEINGRMILKAGYHRSFAVVRAAMNAPEASDTSLLVALTATAPPQLSAQFPTQGLRTTILGSRPPLFSDFFDSSLAMKVKLRRKKFEYHIRFEQVDDL
jgi:hypothetical protein